MLSRYRWTWAGLAFGLVLSYFGFGAAGFGHGTYLPLGIFGAPLSAAIPLVAPLLLWPLIGGLLDLHRTRIVLILLGCHVVSIFIVPVIATIDEHGEEWTYFYRVAERDPVGVWIAFSTYALGLIAAWVLAIKQMNHIPPQA